MSIIVGSILADRYRIDALLGEGGMGAVYRAFDIRLNMAVAVKEHLEDPSGRLRSSTDPTVRTQLAKARERFQNEAQVLARLRHPGLPVVHDHFVIQGEGQYLVMDFVEGHDLQVLSTQAGPLGEKRVIEIGMQVCEIIEYLHSQDPPVIHRDIKPANLRVTLQGKIILVDFGICKEDIRGLTKTAARAVSEGFSPPEMYTRGGHTDVRSDLYSLGATLLALVTGEIPPTPTERFMGRSIPRLPDKQNGTSPTLQAIFNQALDLKPEERYQTASEMRTALQRVSAEATAFPQSSKSQVVGEAKSGREMREATIGKRTRVVQKGSEEQALGGSKPPALKKWLVIAGAVSVVVVTVLLLLLPSPDKNPVVVLETSEGRIELELFPRIAPKHVDNFLGLVRRKFYDSLVFHRVIDGFMIQTGDPNGDGSGGSGTTVPAEFNDSLHHAGTLGMARSSDPNSASSQFYICMAPAPHLDHKYTVFGKTIVGFDVVQRIGKTPTSGSIQRIVTDTQWKDELLQLRNDGKGDVVLVQNELPAPDRPLKRVYLIRAYEKK